MRYLISPSSNLTLQFSFQINWIFFKTECNHASHAKFRTEHKRWLYLNLYMYFRNQPYQKRNIANLDFTVGSGYLHQRNYLMFQKSKYEVFTCQEINLYYLKKKTQTKRVCNHFIHIIINFLFCYSILVPKRMQFLDLCNKNFKRANVLNLWFISFYCSVTSFKCRKQPNRKIILRLFLIKE